MRRWLMAGAGMEGPGCVGSRIKSTACSALGAHQPAPAQGWYSNTSSLLQGVVQAGEGGQLEMDFLSTGEHMWPWKQCGRRIRRRPGIGSTAAGLAAGLPQQMAATGTVGPRQPPADG